MDGWVDGFGGVVEWMDCSVDEWFGWLIGGWLVG